jgi:hypothetical protein
MPAAQDGQELIGWLPPAHQLHVDGQDWSCHVTRITVRHGRDDHISQPSSGAMTVELAPIAPETLEGLTIGAPVTLTVTVTHNETGDTRSWQRFAGVITDVDWDLEDRTGRMIAVDRSARLDNLYVGDTPWPEQTDLERAAAILTAAGLNTADPADVVLTGPSHVRVPARDVDRQKAWGLLSELAADTIGVAWVDSTGAVRFSTAPSRDAPTIPHELRGCDIAYDAKWLITDSYTNRITVKNDTAAVTVSDDGSIATYGLRETSATVRVVDADLPDIADRVLVQAAEPRWRFPQLVWAVDLVQDAPPESATWDNLTRTWDEVTSPWDATLVAGGWPSVSPLGLDLGDLVTISGSLPPAPQPIPDLMHLEGDEDGARCLYRLLAGSSLPRLQLWAVYQIAGLDLAAARYAEAAAAYESICTGPRLGTWQDQACALKDVARQLERIRAEGESYGTAAFFDR